MNAFLRYDFVVDFLRRFLRTVDLRTGRRAALRLTARRRLGAALLRTVRRRRLFGVVVFRFRTALRRTVFLPVVRFLLRRTLVRFF